MPPCPPVDPVGRVLGTEQFPATPAGYTGAGLTRLLQAEHIDLAAR
ncbi:hypothetical protein ABZW49_18225 [Nonomuraea wenchangensis]